MKVPGKSGGGGRQEDGEGEEDKSMEDELCCLVTKQSIPLLLPRPASGFCLHNCPEIEKE